jgi:hypothetical protein
LLLALSASPEELEVAMISVTYGNVPLQSCLRNVVALFHVLEKELEWRKSTGRPEGFETMRAHKPIVAVGAEHSLEDEELMADYFRKLVLTKRSLLGIANSKAARRCRWLTQCARRTPAFDSNGDLEVIVQRRG